MEPEVFNHGTMSMNDWRANWQRPEATYCHFTRGEPVNQIQFAFRQNWLEFAQIMEPLRPWAGKKCLEVGAGRGTMSMYFADAGFDCTLLDACEEPLREAAKQFAASNLPSPPLVCGDALKMPFEDGAFDVVHSYGLLEHFENPQTALIEQARLVKPGGIVLAYIVPWEPNRRAVPSDKKPVFRNGIGCREYANMMGGRGGAVGVYPFPIVSKSPDFPFTLNSDDCERALALQMALETARSGWLTADDKGQAIIAWWWKQ